MQPEIKANVCLVCYCGRLVCAALPLTVLPPFHFDTKMYCSPRCAESQVRGKHRTPSGPLITCDVCCEDKSLIEYIHKTNEYDIVTDKWNLLAPSGCLPHLAPELLNLEEGTCTECLRSHILTQFETRGAININCIQSHATPLLPPELDSNEQSLLLRSEQWLPYAQQFLPEDMHDMFYQQLFDHFIHNTTATLWICPSNCGYGDGILQPSDTPGFPHVECPGCHGRFCVNCKVLWHDRQTCQQYRAQHPELRDRDEVRQLHEMARLGARRCPRCQFIIVKEGGCDHVHCEQCRFDFIFPEAERVVAPPDYVPAPADSAAASSFRGWGQLRQAQQNHIDRNRTADEPFDIGIEASQHEAGVFYYDPNTNLWAPEMCELDEIAGRAEGRRYVRKEDRDRHDLWSFVAVEHGQQGSVSLHEALLLELQPSASPIPIPAEILRMLEGPLLNGNADNMVEHPLHIAFGDEDPTAPALAALDQLINNPSAEEGPHEAEGAGGDEDNQEAGGTEQPIRHPLLDILGPPRDATDAFIDHISMTAMQPGVGRVMFGFGLGMPPMHLFEGDEDQSQS
jgi:hypothetical protein